MKDPILARRATILLMLAAYAAISMFLNSIRATADLPVVWILIALQFAALLTFGFCCYYRIRLQHNALAWLIIVGLVVSRVNNWEIVVLPIMALLACAVSLRTATPVVNSQQDNDFTDHFDRFSRIAKETGEVESAVAAQPGSALLLKSYLGYLEQTEALGQELLTTAAGIPAAHYLRSTVDKAMSVVADILFARATAAGDLANESISYALSQQIESLQAAASEGRGIDALSSTAIGDLEDLESLGKLVLDRAGDLHDLGTALDSR